ncbi:hypothetical protein H0H87_002393 [Tephrocybe sp. NHM501043]|nr:hypothetical protein H0H87_002393 [Tephrocybe sp. NHM501043]
MPEHAGNFIVVLRVVKVLEPITVAISGYDMYLPIPQEGQLVKKRETRWHDLTAIYTFNLDRSAHKALRLLIDRGDTIPPPPEK